MRALTLTQPWAGLVASGIKLVENRPWKPPGHMMGERFAIHASRQIDQEMVEDLILEGIDPSPLWRIKSAIIGVATLDTYVTAAFQLDEYLPRGHDQARWFFGPIGFVLRDVIALATPVPAAGALSFWRVPDDVERKIMEQL